jgi:hypothetical protein
VKRGEPFGAQPDLLVLMVGTLVLVASIFNLLTPLQQTERLMKGGLPLAEPGSY